MAKFLYYIIVLPFSRLPLWILYIFSDFFFLLLISIVPYRRKVVMNNLRNSFPNKTNRELNKIKRRFYRHFTDLLAEGIKNLSISKNQLSKRFKVRNPEIMQQLFNENKTVILVSGHYNNWEWLIRFQNILFPHQAFGIGMPMTSKFWDKKINEKRSEFGMKVVHAKNFKEELEKNKNIPKSILVLSDQSPGDSNKSYWMEFLHQQTAVLFGAELMAHENNFAVVGFTINKVSRGKYEMQLELITDNPRENNWGEITEAHTKMLEKAIIAKPQYWIWSHKRWKRAIPKDLQSLKEEQKLKFNAKYKSEISRNNN